MSEPGDHQNFYNERVPAQFNRTLEAQRAEPHIPYRRKRKEDPACATSPTPSETSK